ncbi:MAG: alpha-1,2-fucosyltransferase [Flavobacterium sp.]|nr:alpha-1,2-fucosyltransferase [Flavobacterium sp.]
MVIFSQLEKKGNLGNQLFQIASTIGIAEKNLVSFAFPNWKYANYFENKLPVISNYKFIVLTEKHFHFHDWEINANENFDLNGWMQTEKYFNKSITNHYFKFNESFADNLKVNHKTLFEKKTILISIRRGDFVGNIDYFQLPILYYILALNNEFPNWRNCNLLFTSDDIGYCKIHFSFLINAFFAENLTAIEQLCLGSLCDDFIISNSTFSWWIAYLGEKSQSKIVHPLHYFDNQKALECSDKDYFPLRWSTFSHLNKKIELKEVTFIIENVNQKIINYKNKFLNIEIINQNFNTNLIFDENFQNDCKFLDYQIFTKQRLLKNKKLIDSFVRNSIENSSTNLIIILDSDHLLSPFFISESIADFIKSQKSISKYELISLGITRKPYFNNVKKHLDIGVLNKVNVKIEILKTFLIFDKTKIDFKIEMCNFKSIKCQNVTFSFSHKPMLYFGIKEKFFWLKFQLFFFNKFYLRLFFKKKKS